MTNHLDAALRTQRVKAYSQLRKQSPSPPPPDFTEESTSAALNHLTNSGQMWFTEKNRLAMQA